MRKIIFVVIIFFLAGCANHIKYIENAEDVSREESSTAGNVISDINGEANNKEKLAYNLELDEIKKSIIAKEKHTVKLEEFTPYQGWRESYEFFLGIGGIPVAIVLNVLDIIPFFGAIPNDWLGEQFSMTMSGLNPFMNMESEKRSEFKEISRSFTKSEKEEVKKVTPLAKKKLQICLNEEMVSEATTDEMGKLKVDMFTILSKQRINEEPRKIVIYLPQEKIDKGVKASCEAPGETSRTEYFKRNLAFSLYDASKYLFYLNGNSALDPSKAAESVLSLSTLGFEEWSMRVEDDIRKQYKGNPEFLAKFSLGLKKGMSRVEETNIVPSEKTDAGKSQEGVAVISPVKEPENKPLPAAETGKSQSQSVPSNP
ncbi:MAG: hypothetical protein A3C43_09495 [Candidatus Schekmanbacteria bacterium RIFCSPHIGHO2_02_FULL_38_11]|uniref:Lipoprotein n=1 Tax=Candidatus Schekmanbacteria bacterium RIFCSPLOWO2_12_FULL_38_15 TaxID=1817883 RepID=A0A1F7SLQ6_9BACT|nr:MAG: hypothetical protein A2043_10135 [Candidatus Schekmanbacteria bacterium GWA2_38_9]OGL48309.1 MAG: hypothetical protein A3H37_00130 [Candidatus Schekmanbacteria bacterium RIFCSPLOWO2_02_FULL_38_14]OGL49300.1 MAG: hypothetical protein A3C43_09495 [Candidatus Schekmanbacteria bacterium RIFCSPHIGHO2_02_FULL_38_11]OGL54137.1 MAG: hypothetical protein A3G31_05060 [Candidatus Schekmanbacteria bacterium RIFCSPLOWO2_12_FULL_38_15]